MRGLTLMVLAVGLAASGVPAFGSLQVRVPSRSMPGVQHGVDFVAEGQERPPLVYVYGRRNPRWDAQETEGAGKIGKPYRPLRHPPGTLPGRKHHGRAGGLLFNAGVIASLSSIPLLAVGAEWLAVALSVPPALPALSVGLLAGPVTNLLDPNALLGDLLLPLVSLCVALLLFDGALRCGSRGRKAMRRSSTVHLSIGAALMWLVGTLAAYTFVGLLPALAVLLGAILMVNGRPVGAPALRSFETDPEIGPVLDRQSVVLELVGTVAVIMIFEATLGGDLRRPAAVVIRNACRLLWIGGLTGALGSATLILLLRYRWIPEPLQRTVMLVATVVTFAGANVLQGDAGFVAVIALGLCLANQSLVRLQPTPALDEAAQVGLLSVLCVVLAARLNAGDFAQLGIGSVGLLVLVLFVGRPVMLALSTWRWGLDWRDGFLLAALLPQGVLPVGLVSILALRLMELHNVQAGRLIPLTIVVLFGSAAVSSLAGWITARRLRPAVERRHIVGESGRGGR